MEGRDVVLFLEISFESSITSDGKKKNNLSPTGLIKKIISHTEKATARDTPCAQEPLGSDKEVNPSTRNGPKELLPLSVLQHTPRQQYSVHMCAKHIRAPKKSHVQALKRIARCLMETVDKGIEFVQDMDKGLDCRVGASFAGLYRYDYEDEQDIECVKSHSCFILTLFGCPILWNNSRQGIVTLSSTAEECVTFSDAMSELLPMRRLLLEISSKLDLPIMAKTLVRSTVSQDNQACLSLVNVPKMSPRNKYLALR